jgi:hypothetical protein
MTDTIGSAEGKRRGCAFINLSNEFVPPFGCMMLVGPEDKRNDYPPRDAAYILNKATGAKFFGFEFDNEYGVYTDKCDQWAMILQDPNRFVFNGDTTVPPGGTGYCSFGEYPARANQPKGLSAISSTDYWYGLNFAAVENSWSLERSGPEGAFKFFGKVQEVPQLIWIVPNQSLSSVYSIAGTFTSQGIASASLLVTYSSAGTFLGTKVFVYPQTGLSFTEPITLKMPGIYVLQYKGTANALNPDPADTTIAYELSVAHNAEAGAFEEDKASGVLKKVSDGYSSFWPSQSFEGGMRIAVRSSPVTVQIKQTLTAKVETEGQWRIVYDKAATASANWLRGTASFGNPWWVWGRDFA